MYIDRLKRGAGGILSHDEGYFGSQEGSVPFKNDLETTLLRSRLNLRVAYIQGLGIQSTREEGEASGVKVQTHKRVRGM